MSEDLLHQTHPEVVKRLGRAEGHLRSTITMIEVGRPCVELAQQLHAVEKAIVEAKRALIRDHVDHCLEAAVGQVGREQRLAWLGFAGAAHHAHDHGHDRPSEPRIPPPAA